MELDPAVTREGDRILIDGVEVDRSSGPIHGIAMDLGTTTVVLRLIDLETGEMVADASFENPQRFGGSDIMARIQYDTLASGEAVAAHAGRLPEPRHRRASGGPEISIYEMVVVGNSTMRDLFFRQSVYSIGQSPYRSITELEMAAGKRTTTSLVETGRRCLLPIHPRARVYGAPIVSGHVGADAAACMLAADMAHEDAHHRHHGYRHQHGADRRQSRSHSGGLVPRRTGLRGRRDCLRHAGARRRHRRRAHRRRRRFHLQVIGGTAPQGICGSGLVAMMSELLRTGRMNERGRFEDDGHRITLDAENGIYFLESDVNELAQAKGANVAGLQVVAGSQYGIDFDQAEPVLPGGRFGRHLNIDAAARIGLIPAICRPIKGGADRERGDRGRVDRCCSRWPSAPSWRNAGPAGSSTAAWKLIRNFFDFFVEGCQFQPVEARLRGGRMNTQSANQVGQTIAFCRLSGRASPRQVRQTTETDRPSYLRGWISPVRSRKSTSSIRNITGCWAIRALRC
jgi:hypothetical protein